MIRHVFLSINVLAFVNVGFASAPEDKLASSEQTKKSFSDKLFRHCIASYTIRSRGTWVEHRDVPCDKALEHLRMLLEHGHDTSKANPAWIEDMSTCKKIAPFLKSKRDCKSLAKVSLADAADLVEKAMKK